MMDHSDIYDAETKLSLLLDRVERGHDVVITREGVPVARLVPARDAARPLAAAEKLRMLRASIAARGERLPWVELKSFRDEGRG